MIKKEVSIIVPVYNCKGYIKGCIESLVNQTYRPIEIILIDDGSTDGSGEICDQYAKKDRRIKAWHIDNSGVSEARNFGINQAEGAYIQFVDADDWIKPYMTRDLVDKMEGEQVDLVVCGYERITKYITRKDRLLSKGKVYDSDQYLLEMTKDPTGYYYGVIWNKLFKRSVILEHKILFDQRLSLGEDFVFNLAYLTYISKVYVLNKRLYIYNYCHSGSLSRYGEETLAIYIKELKQRNILFQKYKECFENYGLYAQYKKEIYCYWQGYTFKNLYDVKHGLEEFSESDREKWQYILNNHKGITAYKEQATDVEVQRMKLKVMRDSLMSRLKKPLKYMIELAKKEQVKINEE